MGFAARVNQRGWLLWIASIVVMLGTMGASVSSDTRHPPAGLTDASPPTPMPAFQLPAVDGSTLSSTQLQGKVVVVRFWATW